MISLREAPGEPPVGLPPVPRTRWQAVRDSCVPTVRYWLETEVHVYAFSVAANILLSFFPFLIVMISLCRYVFHWEAAVQAIYVALNDYFPAEMTAFLKRNLEWAVISRGPLQWGSLLLLLFTANGIFEPLEVALNRVWGVRENRSFLRNQLVSLVLIFACGALFLSSVTLTAMNTSYLGQILGRNAKAVSVASTVFFRIAALPVTILMLWLIYWLLPNRKLRPIDVLPVAVIVGFVIEGFKYLQVLLWPPFRAKLEHEYGPFINSVSLVFWGFLISMILLGGAEWAARGRTAE